MIDRTELKRIQVSIRRPHITPGPGGKYAPLLMSVVDPYSITDMMPFTGNMTGELYDHPQVKPNFIVSSPDVYGKSKVKKKSKKRSSQRESRSADRKLASRRRQRSRERRTTRDRSSSSSSDCSSCSNCSTCNRKRSRSITPKHNRRRTPPNLSTRPGEYRPDKGRSRYRRSESRSPSTNRHRRRRQSPQYRRKQHRTSRSRSGDRPSRQEFPHQEYMMPAVGPPIPDSAIIAPFVPIHLPPMPFAPAPFMPPRMMQPWQYRPKNLPTYMNRPLPKYNNRSGLEPPLVVIDSTV